MQHLSSFTCIWNMLCTALSLTGYGISWCLPLHPKACMLSTGGIVCGIALALVCGCGGLCAALRQGTVLHCHLPSLCCIIMEFVHWCWFCVWSCTTTSLCIKKVCAVFSLCKQQQQHWCHQREPQPSHLSGRCLPGPASRGNIVVVVSWLLEAKLYMLVWTLFKKHWKTVNLGPMLQTRPKNFLRNQCAVLSIVVFCIVSWLLETTLKKCQNFKNKTTSAWMHLHSFLHP